MNVKTEARNDNVVRRAGSIRTRLALAFALFLGLIVGSAALTLRQMDTLGRATQELRAIALPKVLAVADIERALTTHSLLAKRRVQTTDFRQLATIMTGMRVAEDQFDRSLASLQEKLSSSKEKEAIAAIREHWSHYRTSFDEVLALTEQGNLRRAQALFEGTIRPAVDILFEELDYLVASTRAQTDNMAAAVADATIQAQKLTFGAIAAGFLATLIAVVWTSRAVSRPLLQISAALRRLTEGYDETKIPDLAHRLDEIGILGRAAEAFRASMIETRSLAADLDRERLRLGATVRNMPLGVCMFDRAEELTVWNVAFEEIWQCSDGALYEGLSQSDLFQILCQSCEDIHARDVEAELQNVIDEGRQGATIARLDSGRRISVMLHPAPGGWLLISEDVTERVNAEERIRRLARRDPLTGLANRLSFKESIESALKEASSAKPVALMFIDLDGFKQVNDTLGHPVGDELLRLVAQRLSWVVREEDIVARLGGDEFAVIQKGAGQPDSSMAMGRRIIEQLSSPFQIDGHHVQIGGSVGVALAPVHGDTPDEIQRNADLALYAVKEAGKGHCLLFRDALNERQQALDELEHALRMALKEDKFALAYQPLFDLSSGRIWGAEALLRWDHPEKGAMLPGEFVPLAEELRLIRPIGARVLEMACQTARNWPENLKISVNLSRQQIHDGDIASEVLSTLDRYGLDPGRLELEITEGVLLQQTETILAKLHALRARGISIALDDFGTGYSSLRYLRAFPFDRVKIDAAFVRALPSDTGSTAIVEAICALCETFETEATAEGIESQAQLNFVRAAGCGIGQGFHLARPMPAEEFAALVVASPSHGIVASRRA
ncbi:MAG: EAL domain-containing protein [Pseudomonadota bacterium]